MIAEETFRRVADTRPKDVFAYLDFGVRGRWFSHMNLNNLVETSSTLMATNFESYEYDAADNRILETAKKQVVAQYFVDADDTEPMFLGLKPGFMDTADAALKRIYSLSGTGDDSQLLRSTFGVVEQAFADKDLDLVNELLRQLDPGRVRVIATIGLARATARARNKLPAWGTFVVRLWQDLNSKGLDAKRLMRGLVAEYAEPVFAAEKTVT